MFQAFVSFAYEYVVFLHSAATNKRPSASPCQARKLFQHKCKNCRRLPIWYFLQTVASTCQGCNAAAANLVWLPTKCSLGLTRICPRNPEVPEMKFGQLPQLKLANLASIQSAVPMAMFCEVLRKLACRISTSIAFSNSKKQVTIVLYSVKPIQALEAVIPPFCKVSFEQGWQFAWLWLLKTSSQGSADVVHHCHKKGKKQALKSCHQKCPTCDKQHWPNPRADKLCLPLSLPILWKPCHRTCLQCRQQNTQYQHNTRSHRKKWSDSHHGWSKPNVYWKDVQLFLLWCRAATSTSHPFQNHSRERMMYCICISCEAGCKRSVANHILHCCVHNQLAHTKYNNTFHFVAANTCAHQLCPITCEPAAGIRLLKLHDDTFPIVSMVASAVARLGSLHFLRQEFGVAQSTKLLCSRPRCFLFISMRCKWHELGFVLQKGWMAWKKVWIELLQTKQSKQIPLRVGWLMAWKAHRPPMPSYFPNPNASAA